MSNKEPEPQELPTKDLFDRYFGLRVSSRWAAFYLIATSALILAWSRSPSWSFTMPFGLFKNGKDDLSVAPVFAPVFGPIIEVFFYFNFFKIHTECLALGRFILGRFNSGDKERQLLHPPFEVDSRQFVDSCITWLVMIPVLLISFWILGDFFLLEFGDHNSAYSLLWTQHWRGVASHHRGSDVTMLIYGLWQPWLYVAFLLLKVYIVIYVLADSWNYCQLLRQGGRQRASVRDFFKRPKSET